MEEKLIYITIKYHRILNAPIKTSLEDAIKLMKVTKHEKNLKLFASRWYQ